MRNYKVPQATQILMSKPKTSYATFNRNCLVMKPEIHLASCETPLQPLKSKIHFISNKFLNQHNGPTSPQSLTVLQLAIV